MSKIEWTNETWNVTTGCTRASTGCDNCYAVTMTKRLAKIGATKDKYAGLVNEGKNHFNGVVKLHPDVLEEPLKWRKPRKVFVNSMSDLFHPEVPFKFIDKVFAVMALTPQHTYQVLTKRPNRMAEYFTKYPSKVKVMTQIDSLGEDDKLFDRAIDAACNLAYNDFPIDNVWLGTSVEDQKAADERIPHLLKCPAAVRFLSCEPLLGSVTLNHIQFNGEVEIDALNGKHGVIRPLQGDNEKIDWVIAGGESGHNARPMNPKWVRTLRDQCKESGTAFFFKQWGEWVSVSEVEGAGEHYHFPDGRTVRRVGKKKCGRTLDGTEHNEFPVQTGHALSQPETSNPQPESH